jgi:hypothetical protein
MCGDSEVRIGVDCEGCHDVPFLERDWDGEEVTRAGEVMRAGQEENDEAKGE